jgi:hypothetical protein
MDRRFGTPQVDLLLRTPKGAFIPIGGVTKGSFEAGLAGPEPEDELGRPRETPEGFGILHQPGNC